MMEFLMNDDQNFTILGDTADNLYPKIYDLKGAMRISRYADYKRKSMYYGKNIISLNTQIAAMSPGDAQNEKVEERKEVFGERIAFYEGIY